jgi:uncharacterized membrane protein
MKAFTHLDILAVIWFAACWIGYAFFADVMSKRSGNLLTVINEYRRNWMRQMLARENRMVDAALIGNLLRSISFFASTSIFIVLGLFTLLMIIFVYTFFKYTWSLRQYNYACILVGAAPPAGDRNVHYEEYAQNAARLVGNAAKHFNLALRAYYFGLAALSWFVNPWLFISASTWVVLVLYRREFRSHALRFLMNPAVFREGE